jgi:molybdopterin-guanine dinucleotide biosynthesis protein MobB
MPRPPLVAIIGRKKHGKTTLTVQVAAELTRRGYRVMTIKHGTHTFNLDPSTTDTYRHYHEGNAVKVAMVSPDKFALVERTDVEPTVQEVAERYMADADIVVAEGFKLAPIPKIEIFRSAAAKEAGALYDPGSSGSEHYLAMVTDVPNAAGSLPVIDPDAPDVALQVADVIEQRIMKRTSRPLADPARRS